MSLKVNERIMALRKQKGITQSELAEVLGVSNQSVSKWESAQCCPDIQLLPDIAKYFGVSVDELMGVEVPRTKSEARKVTENRTKINDPLLREAIDLLGDKMLLSTSVLQRKLGVGYMKAKELIDTMLAQGYVIEIRPGFYQRVCADSDRLKSLAKNLTAKEHDDMLDIALAMHAAWFVKKQDKAASVDSAVDAVLGGQWGYSAYNESQITTVMRGQSVFYSRNCALDLNSERIGRICDLLGVLAVRKNLTVMAAIYELTVHAENAWGGIDEIVGKSMLSREDVSAVLTEGMSPYLLIKDGKYRIKGEYMAFLPILSLLCH